MHHSRRSFLHSALALPSALTASAAFSQDSKDAFSQDSKDAPFADFDNGWGNWTVEGDAFGTAPATDALFPGKIKGFGGRGFACSLHPKKGNAATGRLISSEFTIEKPVITFKIGGGNHPGKACLNLVVDGKIERTATGDGTAQLLARSWDVAEFTGKKARLEICDSTTSGSRGYIMVDDIVFTQGGSAQEAGSLLQVANIEWYRFYSRSVFANKDIASAFGKTDKALNRIEYNIWQRCLAPDLQYYAGKSLEEWAAQLKIATLSVPGVNANEPVFEYAYAYMITAWVKSHMRYVDMGAGISHSGTDAEGRKVEFEKRYTWVSIPKMLQCNALDGACRHSAVLIRSLATHAGLKCLYTGGTNRTKGLRALGQNVDIKGLPNHGWNVFEFSNGIALPADGTGTSRSSMNWISLAKQYYPTSVIDILPRHPLTLDWFLSCHYADGLNKSGYTTESADKVAIQLKSDGTSVREHQDQSQKLTFDQWIATDNTYLENAIRDFTRARRVG